MNPSSDKRINQWQPTYLPDSTPTSLHIGQLIFYGFQVTEEKPDVSKRLIDASRQNDSLDEDRPWLYGDAVAIMIAGRRALSSRAGLKGKKWPTHLLGTLLRPHWFLFSTN